MVVALLKKLFKKNFVRNIWLQGILEASGLFRVILETTLRKQKEEWNVILIEDNL